MAKEQRVPADQQVGTTTADLASAQMRAAGLEPPAQTPIHVPATTSPAPVSAVTVTLPPADTLTPLQIRALDDFSGTLAREFALGAAKLCESPVLQPKTKERASRLLRLALAALG